MQNSAEIFEKKKEESIKLKNDAKKFAEKLARNKAEKIFMERLNPMTMFTEDKKRKFIEKITKQYEPIYYKDILNKIISQKVMEEQQKIYIENNSRNKINRFSNKNEIKRTIKENEINTNTTDKDKNIAEKIINSSREVFNLLNNESEEEENNLNNDEISNSILQNISQCENTQSLFSENNEENEDRLVMSILNKNSENKVRPTFNK